MSCIALVLIYNKNHVGPLCSWKLYDCFIIQGGLKKILSSHGVKSNFLFSAPWWDTNWGTIFVQTFGIMKKWFVWSLWSNSFFFLMYSVHKSNSQWGYDRKCTFSNKIIGRWKHGFLFYFNSFLMKGVGKLLKCHFCYYFISGVCISHSFLHCIRNMSVVCLCCLPDQDKRNL